MSHLLSEAISGKDTFIFAALVILISGCALAAILEVVILILPLKFEKSYLVLDTLVWICVAIILIFTAALILDVLISLFWTKLHV